MLLESFFPVLTFPPRLFREGSSRLALPPTLRLAPRGGLHATMCAFIDASLRDGGDDVITSQRRAIGGPALYANENAPLKRAPHTSREGRGGTGRTLPGGEWSAAMVEHHTTTTGSVAVGCLPAVCLPAWGQHRIYADVSSCLNLPPR